MSCAVKQLNLNVVDEKMMLTRQHFEPSEVAIKLLKLVVDKKMMMAKKHLKAMEVSSSSSR
jgi:hypothetical protein